LVTGGAGLIGSYLVNALLARDDTVVALDNLTTVRLANLDEASKSAGFHFVHGSVLDELLVDEAVHQCESSTWPPR
jgi:UDP-glucose 4-epimerase